MNEESTKFHTEVGEALAKGAVKYVARIAIVIFLIAVVLETVLKFIAYGVDDSDTSPSNRSGLKIHTDAKTGVQYLSTPGGGITPRLDKNGRLIIVFTKEAK